MKHYPTHKMQFGRSIRTAWSTFPITNIEDMFVLVTFFAEASAGKTMTPSRLPSPIPRIHNDHRHQYDYFRCLAPSPSEPIGFLGLLCVLLGFWIFFDLTLLTKDEEPQSSNVAGMKSIFKVSIDEWGRQHCDIPTTVFASEGS